MAMLCGPKVWLANVKGVLSCRMLNRAFSFSTVIWIGGILARMGRAVLGVVLKVFVILRSGVRCMDVSFLSI